MLSASGIGTVQMLLIYLLLSGLRTIGSLFVDLSDLYSPQSLLHSPFV